MPQRCKIPLLCCSRRSLGAARLGAAGWPDRFSWASSSGMIVNEAGVHPNVSGLVYVVARVPDAGEDYTALAKIFPTPPASAGIVFDGDEGRLTEASFLHDFASNLPESKRRCFVRSRTFHKALLTGKRLRRPTSPMIASVIPEMWIRPPPEIPAASSSGSSARRPAADESRQ
jgi:hypothetical protein